MRQLPTRCEKCKAHEIQCIDAGLLKVTEYRETFECLVCGFTWHNIYTYTKTKKAKVGDE